MVHAQIEEVLEDKDAAKERYLKRLLSNKIGRVAAAESLHRDGVMSVKAEEYQDIDKSEE